MAVCQVLYANSFLFQYTTFPNSQIILIIINLFIENHHKFAQSIVLQTNQQRNNAQLDLFNQTLHKQICRFEKMIRIANSILKQEKKFLWKEKKIWHEKVLMESYNRDEKFDYFDERKLKRNEHFEVVKSENDDNHSQNNLFLTTLEFKNVSIDSF